MHSLGTAQRKATKVILQTGCASCLCNCASLLGICLPLLKQRTYATQQPRKQDANDKTDAKGKRIEEHDLFHISRSAQGIRAKASSHTKSVRRRDNGTAD